MGPHVKVVSWHLEGDGRLVVMDAKVLKYWSPHFYADSEHLWEELSQWSE